MKDLKYNLKNDKFLKVYLSLFSLLNLIYLYLEIYKSNLRKTLLLNEDIQHLKFLRIMSISNVTTILEGLIICIFLVFLIIFAIKKTRINTMSFLIIDFICLIFVSLISFILSTIFSAPLGNLIQQLIVIWQITLLIFTYYMVIFSYEKLRSIFKHNNI